MKRVVQLVYLALQDVSVWNVNAGVRVSSSGSVLVTAAEFVRLQQRPQNQANVTQARVQQERVMVFARHDERAKVTASFSRVLLRVFVLSPFAVALCFSP